MKGPDVSSFPTQRVVGGDVTYLKFWSRLTHPIQKRRLPIESIFARSASAVAPSEKVQLSLTGIPLRAFQYT